MSLSPDLKSFIKTMPKVELHVHLEGSIPARTVLELAKKNQVDIGVDNEGDLLEWYRFKDFEHFVKTYLTITRCIKQADDLETITRAFLEGQAAQNCLHTEFTFTPYIHHMHYRIPIAEQIEAINSARAWAAKTFSISSSVVVDIPRVVSVDDGLMIADWAVEFFGRGIDGFGIGGPEKGYPAATYREAFARTHAAGIPFLPHAGETDGAASIWSVLEMHAQRIGHGIRCLDDPVLVETLCKQQIPLEVCPTSNVCLGVATSLATHPLPQMIAAGLCVTINSDDPALFSTTLTDELTHAAELCNWGPEDLTRVTRVAAMNSLLDNAGKDRLLGGF